MDHLKIQKKVRKSFFFLTDGSQVAGEVFLSLAEEGDSGPENLGDLLNTAGSFIPVKTEKGIFLLNLRHVVQAKIRIQEEFDENMRRGSGFTITLRMEIGGAIEGDVFISLKNGRFGRVKDYVNEPLSFFRLFQAAHIVYVNQRYIFSIHD